MFTMCGWSVHLVGSKRENLSIILNHAATCGNVLVGMNYFMLQKKECFALIALIYRNLQINNACNQWQTA